jgi:ubiquinone/menaquinone biosynthesis C-methylase UbiE
MIDDPSRFVGSVPENYDKYLVPHIFQDYAEDLAKRVQRRSPSRLLELAAGTGVVTRRIRDLLPGECEIIIVACQFGVMFFPDKQRGFAEVFRVLESGGRYLFNVWDSRSENPFAEISQKDWYSGIR